jgi:putative ABC transport system permease protein
VLGESLRIAVAQPVASAVTAIIVAAVCGVIISTTGQTVAIERDVLRRIDDAGTRTVLVEDTQGRAALEAAVVDRIAALGDVEWALGFGLANDVRPMGLEGGAPVAMRAIFGSLPESVTATPWTARSGTALAGRDALRSLGFAAAAGPVTPVGRESGDTGVVGWMRAEAPLESLNRTLVTVPAEGEAVIRLVVLAESADVVPQLASSIRSLLDPADPASVAVQTSDALVQVRAAVRGELGTFGRNLVTIVLGAGLILTALNVFGSVTARRRDFGRRRALGASRLDIVMLVTVQTIAVAVAGGAAGSVVGMVVVTRALGAAPELDFVAAVIVLAVLAAAIAALFPALLAAYRDPVRILRVP